MTLEFKLSPRSKQTIKKKYKKKATTAGFVFFTAVFLPYSEF